MQPIEPKPIDLATRVDQIEEQISILGGQKTSYRGTGQAATATAKDIERTRGFYLERRAARSVEKD
jgi:hypothetical protein